MDFDFDKSFLKDAGKIPKHTKLQLSAVIAAVESAKDIQNIPNIKN